MNIRILPELWIAVFGFLLNFPWEMLQAPLFENMEEGQFWEVTKHCSTASLGDVVILLSCYWTISLLSKKNRSWIIKPSRREITWFLTLGLLITIVFELLAIRALDLWKYKTSMPTIFSIGLSPLLQWIILPLALLYFLRRFYPLKDPAKEEI
jgi:hypothetical protein